MQSCDIKISRILLLLTKLYALCTLEENLAWYLSSSLITPESAKYVN